MARQNDVDMSLVKAAIEGNRKRKKQMAERILGAVADVEEPRIAVLGLAFKAGTDDCRESPAVEIIAHLLEGRAKVTAYDPKAMDTARALLGDRISYAESMYEALEGADVIAILTEWEEFKSLDLEQAARIMRHRRIMDYRSLLDAAATEKHGVSYQGIGG